MMKTPASGLESMAGACRLQNSVALRRRAASAGQVKLQSPRGCRQDAGHPIPL